MKDTVIRYMLAFVCLLLLCTFQKTVNAQELLVNVSREDGISVLIKEGECYDANMAVAFQLNRIPEEDARCEFALSGNGGKEYSDWTEMTNGGYTLLPDVSNENKGEWFIKFRKTAFQEESISQNEAELISESRVYQIRFDMTAPELALETSSPIREWTAKDILCSLHCREEGSGLKKIQVETENDVLYSFEASERGNGDLHAEFVLTMEAAELTGHNVTITVHDYAGNRTVLEEQYYIDKTCPTIQLSGTVNGAIQKQEGVCAAAVEDNLPEGVKLYYRAVRIIDGQKQLLEESAEPLTGEQAALLRTYPEEGEYNIAAYAKDLAGNCSPIKEAAFRIDTTAPIIHAGNIQNGLDYRSAQAVKLIVEERYYADCHVTVSARRTTPEKEEGVSLAAWSSQGSHSENSYFFNEDGDYYLLISARDAAGNESSKEVWFRIDATPPRLSIQGLTDADITNKPPVLLFHIEELFYDTAETELILMKKNPNGVYTRLAVPEWRLDKQQADFPVEVKEEGKYELKVLAFDRAGNHAEQSLQFTLDYTPPVIGYLDTIHRKYLKSFQLPDNFAQLLEDLTGVNYRVYLNTRNLLPKEKIEQDGKYILKVEASDLAGNETEKTVEFIVDKTSPRVVVSGMKQDGSVAKNTELLLSLYEEEDSFESVKLNGVEQKIEKQGKLVRVSIQEYGSYRLEIKARDLAENELNQTIHMKCALAKIPFQPYQVKEKTIEQGIEETKPEAESWLIWTAVLVVFLTGTIAFIDMKKLL